jgi:hypothetical protein
LNARAQQGERVRLVAVLLPASADHPAYQLWFASFLQGRRRSTIALDLKPNF